jgi:putative FmdB family regulatory protein
MPTYEYECSKCGLHFEKFQRISEPPAKRCPKCRGAVKRLIGTGAGLIFKGSGFYTTDYRSDSYKSGAKSESSASSTAKPAASSTTTPSKPAAPSGKAT